MKLFKSRYFRNVLTLLGSAAAAQVLALLLTPILTRLYTPEAFGFFNAFVGYSGTMALFLFFSIELAIVRPKSTGNLNRVFGLLVAVGGTVATLIFITLLFESNFYYFIGFDKLFDIKYFVFVGILCAALNIVLTYLVTRLEIFGVYAKTQIAFVLGRFTITIALFYLGAINYGLVIGFILPTIINILYLAHKTKLICYKPNFNRFSLKITAIKYQDLILFNTPAAIVNSIIVNFPIFYILKTYGVEVAGLFGLAYRMILLPVSMVNKAVGQVLYKKFIDKRNDFVYLIKFIFKNVALLSMSLPVFTILYFFGEEIFVFIFGAKWQMSGELASTMSPYIFISFIVSPLSYYFVAFDKNKQFTIINIAFLSLLVLSVMLTNKAQVKEFIQLYTFINIFYYLTVFIVILNGVFRKRRTVNALLD
ncbi:MAG: O-antigen/teichoic acid export membrane protein [Colwellia sp.]